MLVTDPTNVENIHNIIIDLTLYTYTHTYTNRFSIKFASVYVDQWVRGSITICSPTGRPQVSFMELLTNDMLPSRIVNVCFLMA